MVRVHGGSGRAIKMFVYFVVAILTLPIAHLHRWAEREYLEEVRRREIY